MGCSDVVLIGFEEFENLGLRYLAAYLQAHNRTVRILPCDRTGREDVYRTVLLENPKVVGFSVIFQRMLPAFAEMIVELRNRGVTAHCTMGGHFPTVAPQAVLQWAPGVDSIVRCEGEETLLELVDKVDAPETWDSIRGLAFRRNGDIVMTPARLLIENLDALPFPVRRSPVATHRGIGICSIIASRGCYHDCSFCSIRSFYREADGPKRRARSPQNVVQEMRALYDRYGARLFIFEDDDLVMRGRSHRQWVKEFIAGLVASGISRDILWRISCRIDDVDSALLRQMQDVGLMAVYMGIEAGNAGGLLTYNKRYTVDQIRRAVAVVRAIALPFEFGFMLLSPNSSFESVREDIEFLRWIGGEGDAVVHFTKMVPYAGTPIARRLADKGRLIGDPFSPDYHFTDPRLDLLQHFCTDAFHHRNFNAEGLVERLRHAKFDCAVVRKFFSDRYNVPLYEDAVRSAIRRANATCVETLSMAARMMERLDEDAILDRWNLLEGIADGEIARQRQHEAELENVMSRFGPLSGVEVPRLAHTDVGADGGATLRFGLRERDTFLGLDGMMRG